METETKEHLQALNARGCQQQLEGRREAQSRAPSSLQKEPTCRHLMSDSCPQNWGKSKPVLLSFSRVSQSLGNRHTGSWAEGSKVPQERQSTLENHSERPKL